MNLKTTVDTTMLFLNVSNPPQKIRYFSSYTFLYFYMARKGDSLIHWQDTSQYLNPLTGVINTMRILYKTYSVLLYTRGLFTWIYKCIVV